MSWILWRDHIWQRREELSIHWSWFHWHRLRVLVECKQFLLDLKIQKVFRWCFSTYSHNVVSGWVKPCLDATYSGNNPVFVSVIFAPFSSNNLTIAAWSRYEICSHLIDIRNKFVYKFTRCDCFEKWCPVKLILAKGWREGIKNESNDEEEWRINNWVKHFHYRLMLAPRFIASSASVVLPIGWAIRNSTALFFYINTWICVSRDAWNTYRTSCSRNVQFFPWFVFFILKVFFQCLSILIIDGAT